MPSPFLFLAFQACRTKRGGMGDSIRSPDRLERLAAMPLTLDGGEQLVARQIAVVVDVAHCSRQLFNLSIARLIQLFIVPSGTFMRSASSS